MWAAAQCQVGGDGGWVPMGEIKAKQDREQERKKQNQREARRRRRGNYKENQQTKETNLVQETETNEDRQEESEEDVDWEEGDYREEVVNRMRLGIWMAEKIWEQTGRPERRGEEAREPREDWKCGLEVAATILGRDMRFVESEWEDYLDEQCEQARRGWEVGGLEVVQQTLDIIAAKEQQIDKEWQDIQEQLRKHSNKKGHHHVAGNYVGWYFTMANSAKQMWAKARVAPISWKTLKWFMEWMLQRKGRRGEDWKHLIVKCVGELGGKKGTIGTWEWLGKESAEGVHEVRITPGHMEVSKVEGTREPEATTEIKEMAEWVCYGPTGTTGRETGDQPMP